MYDWDTIDEFFTDDFAEDVVVGGVVYRGVVSTVKEEKKTADAGRYGELDMLCRLRVADLDEAPETGDKVTVRGTVRRVITVETDSTQKSYVVGLVGEYR